MKHELQPRNYARKQLANVRARRQIRKFEEPTLGVFVVSFFGDRAPDWTMTTEEAIAFCKGVRVGYCSSLRREIEQSA